MADLPESEPQTLNSRLTTYTTYATTPATTTTTTTASALHNIAFGRWHMQECGRTLLSVRTPTCTLPGIMMQNYGPANPELLLGSADPNL